MFFTEWLSPWAPVHQSNKVFSASNTITKKHTCSHKKNKIFIDHAYTSENKIGHLVLMPVDSDYRHLAMFSPFAMLKKTTKFCFKWEKRWIFCSIERGRVVSYLRCISWFKYGMYTGVEILSQDQKSHLVSCFTSLRNCMIEGWLALTSFTFVVPTMLCCYD